MLVALTLAYTSASVGVRGLWYAAQTDSLAMSAIAVR